MVLVDKTLDEPVAVNRIIYNLFHGSADGEEVFILFILMKKKKTKENISTTQTQRKTLKIKSVLFMWSLFLNDQTAIQQHFH